MGELVSQQMKMSPLLLLPYLCHGVGTGPGILPVHSQSWG